MATNVADLVATLRMDVGQFARGADVAVQQSKKLHSAFGNLKTQLDKLQGFQGLGGMLSTIGVGMIGKQALTSLVTFDTKMREVFTLLPQISKQGMDVMSEQVDKFASEYAVSASEVAGAAYEALSAGIKQEGLFDFLETAAKAARGGVTTMAVAVDGLTSVVNAYGQEAYSAAEASDILFETVIIGKTTFEELSDFMYQVVPVAASVGLSLADVSASLAALTAQGTPTRVAASSLRAAIAELIQPASIAFNAFEKASGQTFPQFVAAGGELHEALIMMGQYAEQTNQPIVTLFGSIEAGMVAAMLASETGAATVTAAYEQIDSAAGTTDAAFQTMAEGIGFSMDKLKVTWDQTMRDMAESAMPAIEALSTVAQIPGAMTMATGALVGAKIGGAPGAAVGLAVGFGLSMADVGTGKLQEMEAAVAGWDAALKAGRDERETYIAQLRELGGIGEELADKLSVMGDTFYQARDAITDWSLNHFIDDFHLFGNAVEEVSGQVEDLSRNYARFTSSGGAPGGGGQGVVPALPLSFIWEQQVDTIDEEIERLSGLVTGRVPNLFHRAFLEARREVDKGFDLISRGFTEFVLPDISLDEFMDNMADWQDAQDNVDAMLAALGEHGLNSFASALMAGLSAEQLAYIASVWGGDLKALYALLPDYGPGGSKHPGGSNPPIEGQAAGGPVSAFTPYVVGERGPELFVPRSAGTIVPNGQYGSSSGGVGGSTVNIGMVIGDDETVAESVSTALRRAKQRGG